jgi:hypothetical protein
MTFQQLIEKLVSLERKWDEQLIDDQTFDKLAAEAAMQWSRAIQDNYKRIMES